MNKFFLLFSVLMMASLSKVYGTTTEEGILLPQQSQYDAPWYLKATPELRIGCYTFVDSAARDIYGATGVNTQLGVTYPLYQDLSLYLSASHLRRSGYSIGQKDLTTLFVIPLNTGVRYGYLDLPWKGHGYVQGGFTYFHLSIKNDSEYVKQNFHRNGVGCFAGVGGSWDIGAQFAFDLFAEYCYRWSVRVHITGYEIGSGIKYRF